MSQPVRIEVELCATKETLRARSVRLVPGGELFLVKTCYTNYTRIPGRNSFRTSFPANRTVPNCYVAIAASGKNEKLKGGFGLIGHCSQRFFVCEVI